MVKTRCWGFVILHKCVWHKSDMAHSMSEQYLFTCNITYFPRNCFDENIELLAHLHCILDQISKQPPLTSLTACAQRPVRVIIKSE